MKKKILSLVLSLALIASCLSVFMLLGGAEDDKVLPWSAYQGLTPTEDKDNGTYKFTTNASSNWVFACVQLKSAVSDLMGTADKVKVGFSFSLTPSASGSIRPLVRADAVADAPKTPDEFNSWLKEKNPESGIEMAPDGNIFVALGNGVAVTAGTKKDFSFSMTFSKSELAAFNNIYLMFDDISVTGDWVATLVTVTVEQPGVGIEVTVPSVGYLRAKAGLTALPDGNTTYSFTAYNTSETALKASFIMQTGVDVAPCDGPGWRYLLNADKTAALNDAYVDIAAGESGTISFTFPVKDNKVGCQQCKGDHDVSSLYARLNFNGTSGGETMVIPYNNDASDAFLKALMAANSSNIKEVYELPGEEKTIVGAEVEYKGNTNKVMMIKGNPFKGLTDADFTDGIATVTGIVFNNTTTTLKDFGVARSWATSLRHVDDTTVSYPGTTASLGLEAGGAAEFTIKVPKAAAFFNSGSLWSTDSNVSYTDMGIRANMDSADATGSVIFAFDNATINENLSAATPDSGTASITPVYELPEYSTPTPEVHVLTNGNAESGLTNWAAFTSGTGTLSQVQPGANGTANAIKFVPSSSPYASVGFDLAPAILDLADLGFSGAGAGKYTVTFYAKAEAGQGGKFTTTLNSQNHANKGANYGTYVATENTYAAGTTIDMTDEWQQFTITLGATESFIENLVEIYKATGNKKTLQLILRLDGASGAYKESQFTYYIDEVTIEKAEDSTPTPTATATTAPTATPDASKAVGIKVTIPEGGIPNNMVRAKAGLTTLPDGKNTYSYTIYNPSDKDFSVGYYMQTGVDVAPCNGAGWRNVMDGDKSLDCPNIELPANSKGVATFSFPVSGNKVKCAQCKGEHDVSSLWARLSFTAKEGGEEFVVAYNGDASDDMLKAILAANGKYVTEVYELPQIADPTPTPVPGTVIKEVVNGDAENGTTNWMPFASGNGTLTQEAGGANGTAHAIKFVPTSGKYASIGFDLGPAIINNLKLGYAGGGAGKYEVTFYAKAEAGQGGKFTSTLNSQNHGNKGGNFNGYTATMNTYTAGATIEMTDEWQKFTVTFDVTQEFLDNILAIYDATENLKTLQLILRLDGANGAFKDSQFTYYVDEVTIEAAAEPTLEPGATPTPVPDTSKKVVNGDAENGTTNWGTFLTNGGKVEQVTDTKDGKGHSIKYSGVTGPYSSLTFDLGPAIIQDEANNYKGAGVDTYTITFDAKANKEAAFSMWINSAAHMNPDATAKLTGGDESKYVQTWIGGKSVTLTTAWQTFAIEIPVTQDYLTTVYDLFKAGRKEAYNLSLRFDGSNGVLKGATEGNDLAYWVDNVVIKSSKTPGGDEPEVVKNTGVKITVDKDMEGSAWIVFNTKGGTWSAADVKNGELVATFRLFNEGDEDIIVTPAVQTTAKKADGSATWAGTNGETVEIAAGESELLEVVVEVNKDNTITVLDEDYDISKFFFRMDIKGELAAKSVLVLATKDAQAPIMASIGSSGGFSASVTTDKKYGTGDMFPVAIVSAIALTAVVMFVVAKKKREEN